MTRTRTLIGSYAAALVALAALWSNPAQAADTIARFDGGIGSQPLRALAAPNLAFGLSPGGAPWVIADLRATFKADGSVSVDGKGLLLGGGNNIGRTGGQSVRARLICDATSPTFTVFDSALVPLEPNGDFKIRGFLSAIPTDSSGTVACANAALLILNPGNAWFAAGIPKL